MKSYGQTHIGNVRLKNDDSFYCSDGKRGIYIVADGMGGYRGGQLASRLAVSKSVEVLQEKQEINAEVARELLARVREGMQEEIRQNRELRDMGTTLICCLSLGNDLSCLHVGDSRAYLITAGHIKQLTEDHTLVNILYKNGIINKEAMRTHPKRNILMKSVSATDPVEADLFRVRLEPGDYLLLCSDGLTDSLAPAAILPFFEDKPQPEDVGPRLVEEALAKGGSDNIVVVIIKG